MSALTMDDPVTRRLVLQHVASAEKARDQVIRDSRFGNLILAVAAAVLGRPLAKRMNALAAKFQDQAIWFTGLASKIAASPATDAIGDYSMVEKMQAMEEEMVAFYGWTEDFMARHEQMLGNRNGKAMDAARCLLAGIAALRDASADLRGALQAYEASREVISRAGRRVATTPAELDAELQQLDH